MSISHPVSSVASLTFCPLLPIAKLKCSSDTTTSILFWSSSNTTFKTSAGERDAIAKLARERVPDEVAAAMGGDRPKYGKDYIIPSTFDPRLISVIPVAVARAALKTKVARK